MPHLEAVPESGGLQRAGDLRRSEGIGLREQAYWEQWEYPDWSPPFHGLVSCSFFQHLRAVSHPELKLQDTHGYLEGKVVWQVQGEVLSRCGGGGLQEKKIPVSGIYAGVGRPRTIFHSGDSKSITKR